MSKTVICQMLDGEKKRVYLGDSDQVLEDQGADSLGTGIDLEGVWKGSKTGRVIVATNSRWQRIGSQECQGLSYHEADEQEIADLAERYDVESLRESVGQVEI